MYLRKQFLFILPVISLEVMSMYSKPFAPKLCQRLRLYKNCPHFTIAAEKMSCPVFGRKTSKLIKANKKPTTTSITICPEKVTVVRPWTKLRPPKGYKKFVVGKETGYLKIYKVHRNWDGAQAICQKDGGSLVKIKNREKEVFVKKLMAASLSQTKAMTLLTTKGIFWIGLRDLWCNDTYLWTDGTPPTYFKWMEGEPTHGTENCVELIYFYTSVWYDNDCLALKSFVCEVYILANQITKS